MKLQITEHDIAKMVNMAVKKIISESRWGNDEDWHSVNPECNITTVILYNPLTKKYVFFDARSYWNLDWRERLGANKRDMLKYAEELGDGPIFRITFNASDIEESDDSFSYDIGMDSGTHHQYSYYPTAVEIEDIEYDFEIKNGQESNNGDYEDLEVSKEDEEFITKVANDNLDSLRCE